MRGAVVLTLTFGLLACGGEPTPPPRYFFTCGDPVCRGDATVPGLQACTSEQPGDLCAPEGRTCDPVDECNRLITCAVHDPTGMPGGCPISSWQAKGDIVPLDASERTRLFGELRRLPLSTWAYRAARGERHLGFVIEDLPAGSPAVAPDGGHVDLYGYTSLTAASVQELADRLERMQVEVAALRAEVATLRSGRVRPAGGG